MIPERQEINEMSPIFIALACCLESFKGAVQRKPWLSPADSGSSGGAQSPGTSKRLQIIGQSTGEEKKKFKIRTLEVPFEYSAWYLLSVCVLGNYPRPSKELSERFRRESAQSSYRAENCASSYQSHRTTP